jgi:hypothetical protein
MNFIKSVNMYNPYTLLNPVLLKALLQQPMYFVRQHYPRGALPRNNAPPALPLFNRNRPSIGTTYPFIMGTSPVYLLTLYRNTAKTITAPASQVTGSMSALLAKMEGQ